MTKTFTTLTFLFFLACNQPETDARTSQVTVKDQKISFEESGSPKENADQPSQAKLQRSENLQKDQPRDSQGDGQKRKYRGAFSNGMKGDSISFVVSADGKKLEELTFKGYWRCSGKLESILAGPEGSLNIVNGKVDDHISEPPDGGSTAWRFQLKAEIENGKATGEFRMNINNLGCDTYLLKFEAVAGS